MVEGKLTYMEHSWVRHCAWCCINSPNLTSLWRLLPLVLLPPVHSHTAIGVILLIAKIWKETHQTINSGYS